MAEEDSVGYVLDKLYGNRYPSNPIGLNSELTSVYTVLRNTAIQKRGYQCILLGSRATGKTMIIDTALRRIANELPGQHIVIRINGLCHSDDKLALREIAKQLDAAIGNGDESIEKPSMSQTLKSVNQLFDAAAIESMNNENPERQIASVVFIIEELERYTGSHQVLAYELFDLTQTSPIGVTVIGTSTRLNLVDLLEKRNRSRNNAVIHTLPKPASTESLIQIAEELLKNPFGKKFIEDEELKKVAEVVFHTTNSVRHLASLLVPYVLKITNMRDIMQPSTSELLLSPFDAVPELHWALLICAARAVVRYETQSVNLVIVLDEWRALTRTDHSNRFAEFSARVHANKEETHLPNYEDGGIDSRPVKSSLKPDSTPSSLLAVRHSWESLHKLGMLEPVSSQSSQEDLKMYVPELDLDDLRDLLPRTFSLYGWTKLD